MVFRIHTYSGKKTNKFQSGMELGLFNDRIILNSTYSCNRSSNQLLPYSVASIVGQNTLWQNLPAIIENVTWEFALNLKIVNSEKFKWSVSSNLTLPKNRVKSFPNIENTVYAGGSAGVIIGQPLGVSRNYHFLGVDQISGEYLFEGKNKQPTNSPDYTTDFTQLVSKLPKFYGGFPEFSYL